MNQIAPEMASVGLTPSAAARHHADAGMAGFYEERVPGLPPLLGSPFGTLMLS